MGPEDGRSEVRGWQECVCYFLHTDMSFPGLTGEPMGHQCLCVLWSCSAALGLAAATAAFVTLIVPRIPAS